jgi:hypothetical protein
MKIIEYIRAKYGDGMPLAILKVEAKAFGIEYPLKAGWPEKHGDREITQEMMNKCIGALKPIADRRIGYRARMARKGIDALMGRSTPITSAPLPQTSPE